MSLSLYRFILATLAVASCGYAADQDILTILGQQSGISTFLGFLEQSPDLVVVLNEGTFSVLVPTDEAFATFAQANPDLTSDNDTVRALIQYHIANGTHPSATFGLQPLFVPTLLTNPAYTNVTGGQVIEVTSIDNQPTIVSGVKAESHLVEADIFFLGGLVHIIDSVLTIPLSFPATITKARLTQLVALLNQGGWLTPSSPAVNIVNSLSDLTIFAPNNSQLGATFTAWEGLSQKQLLSIFQYSISQGPVIYSSDFRNNTKLPTLDGISATMTEVNGQFYVDTSLITTTDYLTSNGVLQILDSPLNPNNTGQQPISNPESSSDSGSKSLSAAAIAGIGIALGALLLGVVLVVALCLRTKRRQRLARIANGEMVIASDPNEPPPNYEFDSKAMMYGGSPGGKNEARPQMHEIPRPPRPPTPLYIEDHGHEGSQISVVIQGNPPRHLGFQARF